MITVVAAIALSGCGDSSATAPEQPTFNNISGSYSGSIVGTADGITLDAGFSVTITQNDSSLGGSWALNGTLDDGSQTVSVQGTGSQTGSITSGDNPSVNLTIESGRCQNYSANFSGSYDTQNRRLTLSGPVDILTNSCEVAITYQTTIVLTR